MNVMEIIQLENNNNKNNNNQTKINKSTRQKLGRVLMQMQIYLKLS